MAKRSKIVTRNPERLLTNFQWPVSQAGYQWVLTSPVLAQAQVVPSQLEDPVLGGGIAATLAHREPQWFLTASGDGSTAFQPLIDHTGLFRDFAYTEPTREGILKFAARYGKLLADDPARELEPVTGDLVFGQGMIGEPLSEWQKQILTIRQLIQLWDQSREKLLMKELGRYVHWAGKDSAWYDSEPMDEAAARNIRPADTPATTAEGEFDYSDDAFLHSKDLVGGFESDGELRQVRHFAGLPETPSLRTRAVIASRLFNSEMLPAFEPGDVLAPARFYLQRAVSLHMSGRIDATLMWDAKDKRGRLHLIPSCLLGALWLQFAMAINGDREYRQCEQCKAWFELSPETARTNRVYCSARCRQKDYRERKAEAGRLRALGHSVRDIEQRIKARRAGTKRSRRGGTDD